MAAPMSDTHRSESARRLAAELGLEPDDPLTLVILPLFARLERTLAQSTEAQHRWTDTNLELLKLLTTQAQETQALAESFKRLSAVSLTSETHWREAAQHDATVIAILNSLPSSVTQALSPSIIDAIQGSQSEVTSNLQHLTFTVQAARTSNSNANRFLQAVLAGSAVLVAGAGAFVCYHFGHQQGVLDGQVNIITRWFGDVSNADFWKQMRDVNQDRMQQCLEEQRSECTLTLP